jgi:putative membrane protein
VLGSAASNGKLSPVEFVYRVIATAVAVWVATFLPGITLDSNSLPAKIGTLLAVALVFGLVNLVIKPMVKVAGCLLYALTFGLIGLAVNGLLLLLTSWIAGRLGLPFSVTGFWHGVLGALVIALASAVLTIPLHLKHLADHAHVTGRR